MMFGTEYMCNEKQMIRDQFFYKYKDVFFQISPNAFVIGTEHEWRHPLLDMPTT